MSQTDEFIVTARKWRPLRFSDVVGQEHITNTLRNALTNNRLHHAFLFCGPRGVGKTTTARILGRAVNCLNLHKDGEPCNECSNCKAVIYGNSLDIIEIDGASNTGVDDVRQLRENAKYPPSTGKYKMYIIDEVHMLSNNAFNALLKTLEEPPPHLMFVFATTESHKVPATIVSRCQRFDFRRMGIDSIIHQLQAISAKEGITIDEKSLMQLAKKADGSMRDSQSLFDQVVAFCGTNIEFSQMADALHLIDEDFFFRVSDCIFKNDISEAFNLANEVVSKGYELSETLNGILEHLRNILTVIATNEIKLIETSDNYKAKYKEAAAQTTKADLLRYIQIINQTEASLRFAAQPRIKFELALVQMASMDKVLEIKELIEEIRQMPEIPTQAAHANETVISPVQKKNIAIENDIQVSADISIESRNNENKFINLETIAEEVADSKLLTSVSFMADIKPVDINNLSDTEKLLIDLFGATQDI